MLSIEAYVPKTDPTTPKRAIIKSFTTQTCQGRQPSQRVSWRTRQNIKIERREGKMRASVLLATAPIRDMRSSRSGTAIAIPAEKDKRILLVGSRHTESLKYSVERRKPIEN